jgi:ATP phosphoribosyltransferase regulatory subunit
MRLSAALPTGVSALLFESARRRRLLEEQLVAHLRDQLIFSEIILPVIDYVDPYDNLVKQGNRRELYRFVDADGRVLALRSDFTPMVARLMAPRLDALELPLHLFYRGDVLRYQDEGSGRQREFYQLGAEVIAKPGKAAGEESELLILRSFLELLKIASPQRLLVVLGVAGLLDHLLKKCAGNEDPGSLATAVVRRERSIARAGGLPLLQVVEKGVPEDPQTLGPQAAEGLSRLQDLRDAMAEKFPQIELVIDLAEFADLSPELHQADAMRSYYDGLAFRAFVGHAAEPLGGGGRYDRIFERLGQTVTACGFSINIDRLAGSDAPRQEGPEESP